VAGVLVLLYTPTSGVLELVADSEVAGVLVLLHTQTNGVPELVAY
jgi:hypothetical protein